MYTMLLGLLGCAADGEDTDSGDPGTTHDSVVTITLELAPIVVNEFMAVNEKTVTVGEGAGSDWIELYNAGDVAVPLDGYTITDDLEVPDADTLDGLTILAGGYLLLWADGAKDDEDHLLFELAQEGEEIGLYSPDGYPIDLLTYGEQRADYSAARFPDGSEEDGAWQIVDTPTPGSKNGTGK